MLLISFLIIALFVISSCQMDDSVGKKIIGMGKEKVLADSCEGIGYDYEYDGACWRGGNALCCISSNCDPDLPNCGEEGKIE